MQNDNVTISKTLAYWLRHKPEAADLKLSSEGWADIDAVLAAFAGNRIACDWEKLVEVVETNDKKRYELSADGSRIRARQGHSVAIALDLPPTTPPDTLFHGTVARVWPAIASEGLKPMRRHHVHLSADTATATSVGARRGKPLVLVVDAKGLAATGQHFFLTANGVWLTASVPPAYLKRTGDGRE